MTGIKRFFPICAFTLLFSYIILMVSDERITDFAFILSVILCIVFTLKRSIYAKHILIISVFIAIAILLFNINKYTVEYALRFCGEDKIIYGTVYEASENHILLRNAICDNQSIFGKINVYTENPATLSAGDKITITLKEVFSTASDGLYRYHSLSERDYLTAFADETTILFHSSNKPWYSLFFEIKEKLTEKFFSNIPSENAGVVTALITGNKASFSPQLKNALKYSGAAHIFAVSGMHLSMWTSIFFIFFKRRAKSKFIPNIAAILFVIFYCIFTGYSPSVLRAGIMLLSVFLAKIIKRQADSLNSLGLAGTILLITNPFLAGNVSFLLSFIATFSLIFFNDYIIPEEAYKNKLPSFIRKRVNSVASTLIISLSVIISTIPITALFFGYVSLLSPLSSLIITPFAQATMITGAFAAIIPDISFISSVLWRLTELFTEAILYICSCFCDTDIAIQPTPAQLILPWFLVSFFITAAVFMKYKDRKKTFCCVTACVLTLTATTAVINTITKAATTIYIPENENATMISVINQSAHKSAVFGCGGTYSTAEKTIRQLNSRGILRTDCLIIPRERETESYNSEYIESSLLPRNTIKLYKDSYAAESQITLWDSVSLHSDISSHNAVTLLETDGIKTVICTLPTSDISLWDEKYLSGDIFITRNAIPENLNLNNFSTVIIMTNRKNIPLPDNAYSTATGDITITVKGDSYGIHR